jgi:hypothetical protein
VTVFASIDVGLLLDVVWQSALAGIAVTLLFSFVVLFGSRSAEASRGGHAASAMAYAVLAIVSIAAFVAIVVYGVQVMLTK